MKEFMKRHDLWTKLVALTSGIVMWATITAINNPIVTVNYTDLVVEFSALSYVEDNYNLVLVSDQFPKVDIKVKGSSDDLARLSTSNIKLNADLSGITGPGDYSIDYSVKLPFDGIIVSSKSPEKITISIDEVSSRRFAIDVLVNGEPNSGISYNIPYVDQEITVSGPFSELIKIDSAAINIDLNNKSEDIFNDFEIVLLDEKGKQISNEEFVMSDKFISLEMLAYQTKTVPIKPEFVFENGISEDDVKSYKLSQNEITIKGRPEVVSAIEFISVGPVKISAITEGSSSFNVTIPKLDDVIFVSDIESSLTVDVEFSSATSKVFKVSDFVFDEELPENISVGTKTLEIKLLGLVSAIDSISVYDIVVKPIFDVLELEEGENEVLCEVTILGDFDVSIDGEYFVIMEVE